MKFIKRDKTKGSLTNDIRGASGIVSNNSSGNSSTTLESHRIWGQLFDGTNDVTGDMQNVGSITATGNIQTDESVIIKQLDADGNEVEGGDLTISVEDKKAKFSGKDQYVFDGAIEGTDIKANGNLDVTGASTMNGVTVNGDAAFNKNIEVKGQSKLNDVSSNNITNSDTIKTKNLEVTGSAHFFELIIDKIKAAGGAVLFTPANGFKVDIVESVIDGYKLYWQADDGSGNQADNMWKVNDQALCMSFNQAKEGTNHNISNKYYWSLVTAVLFTPANGFKVDIVESVIDGYKLYWQADDGSGNQADNMWKVNDQALCMSFNQAKEGTNHNISNKYYWSLVTAVSDTNQPVSIEEKKYHYIVISTVTKDGSVNPEIGDTIAMLGYRGTDDKKRQSAIYISAYTSLDKGLTAPLLAQYQGINDFNLESHRKSYFDAVGAKFVGNFEVSNGQTIEDYINNKIDGAKSVAPYIGANGNWFIWDSDTKAYKDSGVKAEGKDGINGTNGTNGTNGKDAEFYKLQPVQELAVVDKNGTLGISLMYNIKHIKGNNEFTVGASNAGYYVRFKPNTSSNYINLSLNTTAHLYTNAKFQTNYHKQGTKIEYLTVQLVSDSLVKDTRVVPVQFAASATLEITDSIKTTVQDNTTSITDLAGKVQTNTNNISSITQKANSIESKVTSNTTNINNITGQLSSQSTSISKLEQKANSIESNVTSNTTTINNLSGSVTSLQSDMSDVKQTASSITSTVSSMKDEIIGANCMLGLNGQGWSSNTIYNDAGNSFHCESTEWFQSHPIEDFNGDYTFSFDFWGGTTQIKILDFTQTYYDDGIYNQYVDFGTYTPCKILTTSSSVSNDTLTNYATSGTSSTWTYTNTETITLAVGDNVAVRVTNSTNNRYNSIYGTVSAINTSSKSVTVKAIALLDQPNTICTLSCPTDKKDGTVINSLHYDEKLGRYWIRFKETRGSAKTFVILFRNLSASNVGWISRLMLEESVEYPHKYNNTGQASQSMIKQTAESIMMNVNNTYVKIGDGNITLNGDTKVNGSLTLNDENQGFLLLGDSGTTEISPKSIGTYNEFKSKTTNIIKTHYNSTIYGSPTVDGALYGFSWNVSQKLGTFKKGSYIKLLDYTNVAFANVGMEQIGIRTPSATFYIHENGTLTKTITVGNKTSVDIGNYTVVGDNVEVMVSGRFTVQASASIWGTSQDILSPRDTNITIQPIRPMPSISVTVDWRNEVPTSSAFMLIGYDGFAANFGTNTTVYCGKDGFIANYGNNEFRITDAGISHNNMATTYTIIGTSSSSSPTTYTVQDPIDTVLCQYGYCKVIFPSNPYNGQRIKIYDKSPSESYINSNGKYVCGADRRYSDRSIWTNQNLPNMAVRIYTYINDTWFEEYTG